MAKQNNNLEKALEATGQAYIAELTKQLLLADKDATGNLIRSLDYKVVESVNGFLLYITSADYLKYVDGGRRPGKFPPLKQIEKWVTIKNIKFSKMSDKQTAFVIAKSISKRGIRPTNVLKRTRDNILKTKKDILGKAVLQDTIKLIEDIIKTSK